MLNANFNNYFEHIEKVRKEFEAAKTFDDNKLSFFMKEKEEWLEITFFTAISQWPSRQYSNKVNINVSYPDSWHAFDAVGYYKPKPVFGVTPQAGPYFHEYPRTPNFYALETGSNNTHDPYLEEHLKKIEDPNLREKAENKL